MIVRKAIKMAASLHVPLLGLVENMTHLVCPHCGQQVDLFGPARGAAAATVGGLPVLARIPVDPELSMLCDQGQLAAYRRNPFVGRPEVLATLLRGPSAAPAPR